MRRAALVMVSIVAGCRPPPTSPAATPVVAKSESAPPVADDAPAPPPELATLPLDVRVADRHALERSHVRDCEAFATDTPCEHRLDFDGDGKDEVAFKIRARDGDHPGIAIAWGGGGISIVAAGARSRVLATDIYEDGVELSWREVEESLDLATWRVADAEPAGFVVHAPTSKSVLPAPGRAGAGLWLDGGDAAEILYWDGARWRRLVVGF